MSPPGSPIVRVVVTDTSILINLIHIGRSDLLGKLPLYSFVVPEEAVTEVREPQQAHALQAAMSSGLLLEVQLADPAELTVYADLIQTLGSGEAACLSLVEGRHWLIIASDERKKFRRETLARPGAGRLLNLTCISLFNGHAVSTNLWKAGPARLLLEQAR